MPLTVKPPSAVELLAGIIARFEYRIGNPAATVRGTIKDGGRGLTIAGLEVLPENEDVTASLMRQIPLGTLLSRVRGQICAAPSSAIREASSSCAAVPAGRTALTDDFLKGVALSYLRETAPGQEPGGTRRMAASYGRPEETIRTWITRARKAGWLGPSVRGRAGAAPGPRLRVEAQRVDAA